MLEQCHKKIQNTGIKKNGKINAHEQLKLTQYDQYILRRACMDIGW